MLEQSYYQNADKIIESYGCQTQFPDPGTAGYSGDLPLFAGGITYLCSTEDRDYRRPRRTVWQPSMRTFLLRQKENM